MLLLPHYGWQWSPPWACLVPPSHRTWWLSLHTDMLSTHLLTLLRLDASMADMDTHLNIGKLRGVPLRQSSGLTGTPAGCAVTQAAHASRSG